MYGPFHNELVNKNKYDAVQFRITITCLSVQAVLPWINSLCCRLSCRSNEASGGAEETRGASQPRATETKADRDEVCVFISADHWSTLTNLASTVNGQIILFNFISEVVVSSEKNHSIDPVLSFQSYYFVVTDLHYFTHLCFIL